MTGYERGVLHERTRENRFTDGLWFVYSGMILEWDLKDPEDEDKDLEISVAALQGMSPSAMDSLQEALDPLIDELDQGAQRFFADASQTSQEDTPGTSENTAQSS
jgi:hypothetical protein